MTIILKNLNSGDLTIGICKEIYLDNDYFPDLSEAITFLENFDSYGPYQEKLAIVCDYLERAVDKLVDKGEVVIKKDWMVDR